MFWYEISLRAKIRQAVESASRSTLGVDQREGNEFPLVFAPYAPTLNTYAFLVGSSLFVRIFPVDPRDLLGAARLGTVLLDVPLLAALVAFDGVLV